MTREEMLDRMSGEELAQWRAFASREPFGDDRLDHLLAVVASFLGNQIANLPVYGFRRRKVVYHPRVFIHDWWKTLESSRAAMGKKLLAIASRHNQKMEIQRLKGESIG